MVTLCREGFPQVLAPLASASQVLGLQVCVTTLVYPKPALKREVNWYGRTHHPGTQEDDI